MKKLICLLTYLFLVSFCFAYDMEDFYELNPKEQVDLWLEEYSNGKARYGNLTYRETYNLFEENIELYKEVLFFKWKETDVQKDNVYPISFKMILDVLNSTPVLETMTEEEISTSSELIKSKIDDYVLRNKTIDYAFLETLSQIDRFNYSLWTNPLLNNPVELKEKYEKQYGIEVQIDWEEIEKKYMVSKDTVLRINNQIKNYHNKAADTIKEDGNVNSISVGKTGPGGGKIFLVKNNRAWEFIVTDEEATKSYEYGVKRKLNNDCSDWKVPDIDELRLIYSTFKDDDSIQKDKWYWSDTDSCNDFFYVLRFEDGLQLTNAHGFSASYIFIRSFLIDKTVETVKKNYEIGDIGPGGGFVFYVENRTAWECTKNLGYIRFYNITRSLEYVRNGFEDWQVPTLKQLNYISKNLKQKNVLDEDLYFWSSEKFKKDNDVYSYAFRLRDADQIYFPQGKSLPFILVRRFSY